MGLFIPNRRAKPRRFDYEPRFYDPKKDQKLRDRMRIRARAHSRRRSPTSVIYIALLLCLALYIFLKLGG